MVMGQERTLSACFFARIPLKPTKREPERASYAEHYVGMHSVGGLKRISSDEDSHKNRTGTNDFENASLLPING